jgi:hypothetical protein
VELTISDRSFRLDVALTGFYDENTVIDVPRGGVTIRVFPFLKIRPVEKDSRITGWGCSYWFINHYV